MSFETPSSDAPVTPPVTPSLTTLPPNTSSQHLRRRRSPIQRFRKRLGKLVKWQIVAVIVLVAIIVPAAVGVAFVTDANVRVQESWASMRRVLITFQGRSFADLQRSDVNRLRFSLDNMTADLVRARQQTGFLRPIAFVRADWQNRLTLLDTALEIGQAAQETITGLQPTLLLLLPDNSTGGTTATASPQVGELDRITELLRAGQGNFTNANSHLDAAQARLNAVNYTALPPDLLLLVQEITQYRQEFSGINQLLISGPDVITKAFGLNDAQNYLVLSQNSDEIRPPGGYISTWGYIRIRRAQLVDYAYNPTSATSPNPPPDSFADQITAPAWWLHSPNPVYYAWDESWTPDFPQTAKMAAWFYDNGQNPRSPVDGVIGIDLFGFEQLLGALGSVTVPGYEEDTVTPDNFRQLVYRIREGVGETPHKVFLAALYKQILSQWLASSQQHGDKLLVAVLHALQEKHIMFYFKDDKLNQAVSVLGWNGAQATARDHDYVMVADTNMSNKSNRSITRQLTYDVQIQDDGSLKSRLSVSYDFSATAAAKDPAVNPRNYTFIDYLNTMQVFVPVGAKLTDTHNLQNQPAVDSGPDRTDFATYELIKFDNTERFQFSYTTPPMVQTFGNYHRYRLLLQKQAGMYGESAEVQITLPAGSAIVSTVPELTATYDLGQPVAVFHPQLITDQWIEIVYKS